MKTNDFLPTFEMLEHDFTTEREGEGIFIKYEEEAGTNYGCIFTLKKNLKETTLYQCRNCRRLLDAERRRQEQKEAPNSGSFLFNGNLITRWVNKKHHTLCTLQSEKNFTCLSFKNKASIYKGNSACTSKDAFSTHHQILSKMEGMTASDIGEAFGIFRQAKNTLDKAGKRKSAQKPKLMDEDGKVIEDIATIVPTMENEEKDSFLIYQNEDIIVLGTKYMAKKFFSSKKVMADGTFQISPKGYTQIYILWFVIEKNLEDESIERCKAYPAFYILMKNKNRSSYQTAFDAIEAYRIQHNMSLPEFQEWYSDDEIAAQLAIKETYPLLQICLCHFHVCKNIVKKLITERLTNFIKKVHTDEQIWVYGQIKKILAIPLLPANHIKDAFGIIKENIQDVIQNNLNSFENQAFEKFFDYVSRNYFENDSKIQKICKFEKTIRTTNIIESVHSTLNKSRLTFPNGSVNNCVYGLMQIDFEFRSEVYQVTKKPFLLPKHKKTYLEREYKIRSAVNELKLHKIEPLEYLTKTARSFIHPKFCDILEKATTNLLSTNQEESIADYLEVILAHEDSSKRVRMLSQKFYGEEWAN